MHDTLTGKINSKSNWCIQDRKIVSYGKKKVNKLLNFLYKFTLAVFERSFYKLLTLFEPVTFLLKEK
jgi:hypothetical protein